MHHTKVKSLVTKYGELIKTNLEEAKSTLAAEEGLTEEDIQQVVAKALGSDAGDASASSNAPAAQESKNKTYEKWKMDSEGGELTKAKHLRDVVASESNIEILNAQAHNTKIKYFEK